MTSRAQRALAGFAAVVLVACTLLVGWHKATVTHGVCVEHGDELHLDRIIIGDEGIVAGGDHERAAPSESAQLESSTWQLRDGDHHCAIAATSRDPLAASSTEHAVAPAWVDDFRTPPVTAGPAPRTLYRLAPKTSPPV